MKTTELTGTALDWAVAAAEGATNLRYDTVSTYWMTLNGKDIALKRGWSQTYSPSTAWSTAGPIIEREGISIIQLEDKMILDEKGRWQGGYAPQWAAVVGDKHGQVTISSSYGEVIGEGYEVDSDAVIGSTPLEAAMRAYVARRLGNEIEVPGAFK
ncbi:phage protein NinX family protein [Sinimarinibacterium sp. NLF-5-8]|uniref:phage protein NinX family protein n=1 Tax=Sinimarinibacterium sp. NLF-5-8 TaxID=2698684 RepID=UPI00137BC1EE|nr:phage protein NinX family protein [Sinimarinibacterium sp. NLF-5-8]QHS09031.1 DUF2591 domain-containing protein [Sinimarinibacterium sp. NLF-5-8]